MLFTWWNTTTVGTWLYNKRNGEHVGTDFQGNKYYRSKKIIPAANSAFAGRERRWVIYNGNNDRAGCPPNGMAGCTTAMTACLRAICRPAHLGGRIHSQRDGHRQGASPGRVAGRRWASSGRDRRLRSLVARRLIAARHGTDAFSCFAIRDRCLFACHAGPERVSGPEQRAKQFGQGCCPSAAKPAGARWKISMARRSRTASPRWASSTSATI
jgi:hypothetical protein